MKKPSDKLLVIKSLSAQWSIEEIFMFDYRVEIVYLMFVCLNALNLDSVCTSLYNVCCDQCVYRTVKCSSDVTTM